ncbi:hypothetical protein JCM15765_02070 [Paradesulfitobacterium aromaticivorans]
MIPVKFKDILYVLDLKRYDMVKRMLKNAGPVMANNISVSKVESLMGYGIAFPGVHHNQKIL